MDNQRSAEAIREVTILPITEFIYNDSDFQLAKKRLMQFLDQFKLSSIEESMIEKDLFLLENHQSLVHLSRYLEFFSNELVTFFDFVEKRKIYVIDPVKSRENYDRLTLDLNEYCGRIGGYSIANMKLYASLDEILSNGAIQIEGLRSMGSLDELVQAKLVEGYKAQQKAILDDFRRYKDNKYIILSYSNEERLKRLLDSCLDENLFLVRVKDAESIQLGQINCIEGHFPAFD